MSSSASFEELCDQVLPQVEQYHADIAKLSTERSILQMMQRAQKQRRQLQREVASLREELSFQNVAPKDRWVPVIKSLLNLNDRLRGREQKREVVDTIMELCERHSDLVNLHGKFRKTVKDKVIEFIQNHHLPSAVRVYETHFAVTSEDKEYLAKMLREPTKDIDLSDKAVKEREEKKQQEEKMQQVQEAEKKKQEEDEKKQQQKQQEEDEKKKQQEEKPEPKEQEDDEKTVEIDDDDGGETTVEQGYIKCECECECKHD